MKAGRLKTNPDQGMWYRHGKPALPREPAGTHSRRRSERNIVAMKGVNHEQF